MALSLVGLVLLTGDVVSGGPLTHADEWLRDAVQPQSAAASPGWTAAAGGLGELGVAVALMAIISAVVAQYSWRLWPIVLAAANFVVAEALVLALKAAVGRPGPGIGADRADYPGYFPSGHTTTAAVCGGTVVFLLMMAGGDPHRINQAATWGRLIGVVLGSATALYAVLGDQHWATDCLAGLLVAVVVLTTSFAVCRAHLAAPES